MPDAPWRTIPDLVDDAARRFGDDEALVEGDERWSFTELADRIHLAARALIASGVERGDRVAVWAPNISEWVVAGLAVHSVGAWLIPINTRFKGREARDVMRRAGVRLLFTVTDFLDSDYVSAVRDDGGVESLDEIVVLHGPIADGTVGFHDFLARAPLPSTTPPAWRGPPRCRATMSATSSSPRARRAHRRARCSPTNRCVART